MPKNKELTPVRGKWFMTQSTGDIRRRLKQYADDPRIKGREDAWVKEQLQGIGKQDLFFPGIAQAITNHAVGTEASYLEHPRHAEFVEQPGNEPLAKRTARALGQPYVETPTTQLPFQQEFQKGLFQAAGQPIAQALSQIGQPHPLESDINQILQGLAQQYQNEFGGVGALGNPQQRVSPSYFSGPASSFFTNNQPQLSDALSTLQQQQNQPATQNQSYLSASLPALVAMR
jgi:hypothetical protein